MKCWRKGSNAGLKHRMVVSKSSFIRPSLSFQCQWAIKSKRSDVFSAPTNGTWLLARNWKHLALISLWSLRGLSQSTSPKAQLCLFARVSWSNFRGWTTAYVAVSRACTLEGLTLSALLPENSNPTRKSNIFTNLSSRIDLTLIPLTAQSPRQ